VCFALVDDDQKQKAIEGSGEIGSQSTALLWKELCPNCPHPPESRLTLGQESDEHWDEAQRPFHRNPDTARCGSRICLLPKACPRHVPSVYYRKTCRQLLRPLRRAAFSCRISASQARIRMHCPEGMHLFNSRELYWSSQRETTYAAPWEEHAHFPLPSELYRVRFAHGTPTALFMARQNILVIINDISRCRSGDRAV
jgi:hypothetical protein